VKNSLLDPVVFKAEKNLTHLEVVVNQQNNNGNTVKLAVILYISHLEELGRGVSDDLIFNIGNDVKQSFKVSKET
jgi:hypothetical protein